MPYIGRDLNRGNYLKLDDISSSFNSSTTTFNLTVGGSAFTPGSAFSILVSVGGVIQEPESAYQVENSEITFANAPTAQDSFFCLALGVPIGIGVPGNGTVNGTQMAKPFNYDGFFFLDDANNRVGINSSTPTVALDVDGIIKASSFTGGSGGINAGVVTCTGLDLNGNGDVSGNFVIGGDLTVNGTTSTIDTNLIGVDKIEVTTAGTNVGVAVTQNGTGDLVRLYDGTSQVVTVDDEGNVGIGSAIPSQKLDVVGDTLLQGQTTIAHTTSPQLIIKDSDTNSPGDLVGVSFRAANNTEYGFIGSPDAGGHTMFIKTVNTVNPIRLQVNSSTRLEVGNVGVYVPSTPFYVDGGNSANFSGDVNIVDSIIHSGDTNTKIRFPAADTISFETGGDERLRIASNGRIGIGTDTDLTATVSLHGFTNPNAVTIKFNNSSSDDGFIQYFNGAMYVKAATTTGDKLIQFQTSGDPRLTIDSSGRVLISGQDSLTSTSLTHRLQIKSQNDANAIAIFGRNGDDIGELSFYEADKSTKLGEIQYRQDHVNFRHRVGDIRFATGGATEKLRITTDGRLLIGHTASVNLDVHHAALQVNGDNYNESTISIISNSSNSNGAYLFFAKQRSGSAGGNTIVQNGDTLGQIRFLGNDGTDYDNPAASIEVNCDGTPGGNDIPGRIKFSTGDNGSLTEKLRISSLGKITQTNFSGIGFHMSGSGDPTFQISDTDGTNQYVMLAHNGGDSYIVTRNNTSHGVFRVYSQNGSDTLTRLRIDSAGRIHTGNPGTGASDDFNITALGTGATLSLCRAASGNASDGDMLGSIAFQSYPAGQAYSAAEASIRSYAETGQSGSAAPTSLNFYTKPSTIGPGASAPERMRIESDGRVHVGNYVAHHTSKSGRFSVYTPTSGKFAYNAIEIGSDVGSGSNTGAIISCRRKTASHTPFTLISGYDSGTANAVYYGGGWSEAAPASHHYFYTADYTTGGAGGGMKLAIDNKGQIYINGRSSNNNSHRGNIVAYAPASGEFAYKSLEIGSTLSTTAATGGLIVAQRKGTTAYPFALVGSWDDGSNCTMYYGGGWGSQSANATMHRFYTGPNQSSGGSSGTEVFTIDGSGNLKQQRISSGGSGFSYFTGSSEYVFGSTTSSPSSGGAEAKFQIHDYKTRATLSINGYMNNSGAPFMQFISSRSGTPGVLGTKAAINDYHGDIRFMGDNGTNYQTLVQSASIMAKQVTTISDGDTVCGGELQFHTGNDTAGAVQQKMQITSLGKLRYGLHDSGMPHAVQARGFVLYPDNGSNNKTTIRVSGLVSGCFIFQMGYYNSAGQGEGGFACAVSGYMTSTNQYTIDNIKAPYAHANSSISSINKQNSYFEFTITNNHASYTGGGTIGIIGDQEMTITVTYSQ